MLREPMLREPMLREPMLRAPRPLVPPPARATITGPFPESEYSRMRLWRPRSVLQLVIFGFFTALAPLGAAIVFTVQTLDELADNSRHTAQLVVEATRLGQQVENKVLDLERRAGQYFALADPELAGLFQRERESLVRDLRALQERVPSASPDMQGLMTSLQRLTLSNDAVPSPDASSEPPSPAARMNRAFDLVAEQSAAVQTWLQASVDRLLRQNAEDADALIDRLELQLVSLALSTLALLLFFTYWINKPVRDLTHEIHALGTEGLSHTIEISGPQEMRDLGSKLEWFRRQLHESDQQKQQFLRHVSHELKTPLSSLREGADLLAEQVPGHLSRQQQEIVEIVQQNGIELQRLIENLIDYNQVPRQELTIETFSIEELVQELLGHYRISLEHRALTIELQGKVKTWTADRYKLRTAMDNLLSNAVNYSSEGGRIQILWQLAEGNLVIDVANTGVPIPPEDADRVFEPFVQSAAKRTGPIKGSGIGLSVARECMEVQRGTLSLVDHPELPVCFRLVCPAHSS